MNMSGSSWLCNYNYAAAQSSPPAFHFLTISSVMSTWRPPSSTGWDSVASFKVSQAREQWIQVYWKRIYPISNTSTLGSNVSRADMSRAANESLQAAEWVLAVFP
ncbi:unnamed protein product [Schistocephalus solidus]|uniref:Uncharacterized protein n=1 Tax=Schistocephalus solidus TaxID=70667 RepID=A0A183TRK9_SCHSO|nr:unnamed protein product [Schistocephalus solidus]